VAVDGADRGKGAVIAISISLTIVTNCRLIVPFYPNVTTLHSGFCYRKSVSRLSVVCNVRAPYPGVETFGNIFSPLSTLAMQPLTEIVPGEPLVGALNGKRGDKISDDGSIEGCILYLCHVRVSYLLMSCLLLRRLQLIVGISRPSAVHQ